MASDTLGGGDAEVELSWDSVAVWLNKLNPKKLLPGDTALSARVKAAQEGKQIIGSM